MTARANHRWGIVLAGGEGERLRSLTTSWLGRHRPKQYCAFTGARSMLEHTWERVAGVAGADRVVTVIGNGHRGYLKKAMGRVVEQPRDCGTAPGLLLALAHVMALDRHATVAVFPSDHFVHPKRAFLNRVREAMDLAERLEDRLVLLAAVPDCPESEFGWIQPGEGAGPGSGARAVARFLEKPGRERAIHCLLEGYVWNTMIMAFKAVALWSIVERFLPDMMERFDRIRSGIGSTREAEVLSLAYQGMASVDFARGVLERTAPSCVVTLLEGVTWSDWGRPQRIAETLGRLGKRAAFPPECLEVAPRLGPRLVT